MPFRKKPLTPRQHIWALRLGIIFVGVFAWVFSVCWEQNTPVLLFFQLTGAIVSGAGAAIIGGLYWKRGTTTAAWVSYFVGAAIAVTGVICQQSWSHGMGQWFIDHAGWEFLNNYRDTVGKLYFPINGQYITLINMIVCSLLYIGISLFEHYFRNVPDFNLDKMLHRGIYDTNNEHVEQGNVSWIHRVFGITSEFTLGDKLLYASTILWTLFWTAIFVVYSIKYVTVGVSDDQWLSLWHFKIYVTLILGVGCTVWFFIGGIYDVVNLFKALANSKVDDSDDGSVVK